MLGFSRSRVLIAQHLIRGRDGGPHLGNVVMEQLWASDVSVEESGQQA